MSLIQGPLFAHPCQVHASRDMSMTMGSEKSLLSFTDPLWPPHTLQNRHSAVNLASATWGQGVTKKGDDTQTGYKEEPCSGVWAEPGNTLDPPPPPWEGTAVLDSHHPTALSDRESLRWILQREWARTDTLPMLLTSSAMASACPAKLETGICSLTDSVHETANTHFLALLLPSKTVSKKKWKKKERHYFLNVLSKGSVTLTG